jgi:glycosyltransferase involved in cell wall biosynthesis/trans-aconitate methyltransferase
MRVLFALTYYRPHVSGLTIYAQRLAEALAARGAAVTVLTSRYDAALPREEHLGGVRVVRAPVAVRAGKGVVMPTFPALAWRLLRDHDVVGIHVPQLEAALVALLARRQGRPCVITYHCDLRLPPGMVNRATDHAVAVMHRLAAHLAHRVVAYTQDYAAHSAFLRGVPGKVVVIPPPVDMPTAEAEAVRQFERQHRLEGADRIGFAARLATEKGVEYMLEALPAILRVRPRATVLFAGPYRGLAGEAAYHRRLRPMLERYAPHWRMLGELSPAQMATFYGACHLTVLPSINSTESFGLVQVESMLCGAPVVASDLPGVRVPIQTTGMGELVPPRDAPALAQAVLRVLLDPERYRRPRDEIARHFSTDRTCGEYLRLFDALISESRRAPRRRTAASRAAAALDLPVAEQLGSQLAEVPAFRALLRTAEAALIARQAPLEAPVLDLGCGDGHFALHAFPRRPALGIDRSLPAAAEAARREAHRWVAAASATSVPLRGGSLGTVVANSVLEHIPDLNGVLGEVARLLRPGGRLLATVPSHRFADLLLGSAALRRLHLASLARRYGAWFNRRARHFHLEPAEWWIATLGRHGLVVDVWHYYFPARALRAFDALHYAGLPTLLSRRLTGRWVCWRNPLTLALGRRWLAPLCDPGPVADGACLFLVARRAG